ncbi:MAG: hypothetical protein ACP5HH_07285 [Fervidicoccaceae archaeon]
MNDYDEIKIALKNHQLSVAESIINHKLDDLTVNLKDYQFARFYPFKIEIVYNLWKLILKFDVNNNLFDKEVENLAITVE